MINKKIIFNKPGEVVVGNENWSISDIGSDEIAVKTTFSLISAGTELACLSGSESWFEFPQSPGYCAVGKVIGTGGKITRYSEGDTVFFYGAHSLYNKINPDADFCFKSDNSVEEKFVPFLRLATIAITALRKSDIELGDNVLVTGMGLVGNLAAQLAQLQGGVVLGADKDEKRNSFAAKCGINTIAVKDDETMVQTLREKLSDKEIDTLIEASGFPGAAVMCLLLIKRAGEIILLGTPRAEYKYNLSEIFKSIHLAHSQINFKGAHEWMYPLKQDIFEKHSFERNTLICFELIKNGRLKISPLITHIIKPEDAPAAYDGLMKKPGDYMGVLIDWH